MRRAVLRFLAVIALIAIPFSGLLAEPVVSTPQAVTITIERNSATIPDALFALMASPDRWWSDDHTWSGDAANMTLDARAGGCWCEIVAGGPSVEHGRVLNFDRRRRTIVFDASLGPLQTEAIAARLQWQILPRDGVRQPRRLALSLHRSERSGRWPWPHRRAGAHRTIRAAGRAAAIARDTEPL